MFFFVPFPQGQGLHPPEEVVLEAEVPGKGSDDQEVESAGGQGRETGEEGSERVTLTKMKLDQHTNTQFIHWFFMYLYHCSLHSLKCVCVS